jgi:hypothetical protein
MTEPSTNAGRAAGPTNVLAVGPVTIFTCLLATAAGALLGYPAAFLYAPESDMVLTAGPVLAGAGGLLAGVLWCRVLYRRTPACGRRLGRLLVVGAAAGAAIGAATAMILSGALVLLAGTREVEGILIGQLIALIAGALAGAVLGLLCATTWRKALKTGEGTRP